MRDLVTLFRSGLLFIVVLGLIGIEAELLLLRHTDGNWQLFPVILCAVALAAFAWYALTRGRLAVRAIQAAMVLMLGAGLLGMWQHFEGNVVYERESDPSLSGSSLYRHALMGATPTLAPGALVQLGLIGLLFCFRHPRLSTPRPS